MRGRKSGAQTTPKPTKGTICIFLSVFNRDTYIFFFNVKSGSQLVFKLHCLECNPIPWGGKAFHFPFNHYTKRSHCKKTMGDTHDTLTAKVFSSNTMGIPKLCHNILTTINRPPLCLNKLIHLRPLFLGFAATTSVDLKTNPCYSNQLSSDSYI